MRYVSVSEALQGLYAFDTAVEIGHSNSWISLLYLIILCMIVTAEGISSSSWNYNTYHAFKGPYSVLENCWHETFGICWLSAKLKVLIN